MLLKALLLVTVISTVAALNSNLTLLAGKLSKANEAETPENFIKLISAVIYKPVSTVKATATFVTGKYLLTAAGFLYDTKYKKTEKEDSGKILSMYLAIRTSFVDDILQVAKIYNKERAKKDDYRKEPAILEVADQSKHLKEGFPEIPKSQPDIGSPVNIFGMLIKDKRHTFVVLSFSSKISPKSQCNAMTNKGEPEDPNSICVICEEKSKPKITTGFDIGMPILTSKEIVGMLRKMSGTLHTKLLFVSTAGHQIWINKILFGKGNGNKGKNEDEMEVVDEETAVEDE